MSVLLVIREDLFRDRLVELGVRFAAAKEKELYVVSQSSGSSLPDVTKLEWEGEEIKTIAVTTTNPFRTIKDLVAQLKPELLMLNDANDHPEQHTKVINQAINEISCEVMIVRLGEGKSTFSEAAEALLITDFEGWILLENDYRKDLNLDDLKEDITTLNAIFG